MPTPSPLLSHLDLPKTPNNVSPISSFIIYRLCSIASPVLISPHQISSQSRETEVKSWVFVDQASGQIFESSRASHKSSQPNWKLLHIRQVSESIDICEWSLQSCQVLSMHRARSWIFMPAQTCHSLSKLCQVFTLLSYVKSNELQQTWSRDSVKSIFICHVLTSHFRPHPTALHLLHLFPPISPVYLLTLHFHLLCKVTQQQYCEPHPALLYLRTHISDKIGKRGKDRIIWNIETWILYWQDRNNLWSKVSAPSCFSKTDTKISKLRKQTNK